MNIIVAGCGKVGSSLARQLSGEGHDVTLIDLNAQVLATSLEHNDIMTVEGNCASMAVLEQAGISKSDLLIAATGTDVVNLLCCLTAHQLNSSLHTIARIRDPEYVEQAYKMQDAFGLSLVVNPERSAANEIANLLKYPGFLKRETLIKSRMQIVELQVDAGSKLCDVPLSSLYSIVKCKVLVCAVLRDGEAVAPTGNFVLRRGDRFYVTAQTENLALLLKNLGIVTHKVKRVILAGGSKISYYLADNLLKSGISVCIIDQDQDNCNRLAALLPNADIVLGDASDQDLLESEGLYDCDALVTLTGLDELNMVISLFGNSRSVPQIITKISREENNRLMSNLPIGSVICPRSICCSTIISYVRAMVNQTGAALAVHPIADEQAEATEFLVDSDTLHQGEPLKKIRLHPNVLVAAISRGGISEIPNGDSHFEKGDSIVIVSTRHPGEPPLSQLNEIFA